MMTTTRRERTNNDTRSKQTVTHAPKPCELLYYPLSKSSARSALLSATQRPSSLKGNPLEQDHQLENLIFIW